jgi:regulator of sirC expression with transglutaminase-like and TPR domain
VDPFDRGRQMSAGAAAGALRPWRPDEIAMRMLNNLVSSFTRRGDLAHAIRAAELRLLLPAPDAVRDTLATELRTLQVRLN